jgi:hypothetical protein
MFSRQTPFSFLTVVALMICRTNRYNPEQVVSQSQSEPDSQIDENNPGILITIISKEKNIDWIGASGFSDKENKTKLLKEESVNKNVKI